MDHKPAKRQIPAEVLAAILVVTIVGAVVLSIALFNRSLTPTVPVTLTSDRSGLVMEPNSKVKMRGVQVGHVATITNDANQVSLRLEIDPDKIEYIPANVEAQIDATSLFGSKFVELVYPGKPDSQRLSAGAVLRSQNVSVEVNTVFQNLVLLLKQIDPAKLNGVLSALAEGVRGQGERIGQATTDTNEVLAAFNPRTDTIRDDFRALNGVSNAYSSVAQDLVDSLDAAAVTSRTVTDRAEQLDALLVNIAGLSRIGVEVLGPSKDNLVKATNLLEPTTNLLMKYNPELTCLFLGAKQTIDAGLMDYTGGANGKSVIMDAALLLGDDPYRYPDNLPINGAKGGPGGKPGCGSLPDVAKNWPVRALVANTGFGTGLDYRPNPGIGFPGYANYLPVTRAVPEPPSIRYPGPPAPGPVPYAGPPSPAEPPPGAAEPAPPPVQP